MVAQARVGIGSLMGSILERITLYMQQASASEPGPTSVDFVDVVNPSVSSRGTDDNSSSSGNNERRRI